MIHEEDEDNKAEVRKHLGCQEISVPLVLLRPIVLLKIIAFQQHCTVVVIKKNVLKGQSCETHVSEEVFACESVDHWETLHLAVINEHHPHLVSCVMQLLNDSVQLQMDVIPSKA